jgi:basic amino acid/polyamine antiporter, APA family
LRPVLGRWQLLSLGLGATIGSGIFVIPGPAAAESAGPAIVLSFAIAALGCGLAGLCYAELAAMCPSAGSAYAYGTLAFGRCIGWLIGWLLILEYLLAAAIVAQACIAYGLGPITAADSSTLVALKSVAPFFVLLAVAVPVTRGVEISADVVGAIVILKIAVICLVIAFGAAHVSTANWHPFLPPNTGKWGEFGWSGVLRAAGIVFYTYLGFDAVSVAAQEARCPQRDIPVALMGTLAICATLFILMMGVVTGLLNYRELGVANPVVAAIDAAGGSLHWLAPLVRVTAVVGMVSTLIVILMATSRILFAMARDGLLPAPIARLHPRWQTPVGGTMLTVVGAGMLAMLFPIALLGQLVSIGVLSAFIAVSVIVLLWRRTRPRELRPFRAPWVPFVPIGSILVCGYMAAGLPYLTWLRFVLWLALGVAIYGLYGVRSRRG